MNPLREDQLSDAARELSRMESLVEKFRIGAVVHNVELTKIYEPSDAAWSNFCDGVGASMSANDVRSSKVRVRIGEVIRQTSNRAKMTVVNMPVPLRDRQGDVAYARMYLGWL